MYNVSLSHYAEGMVKITFNNNNKNDSELTLKSFERFWNGMRVSK